MSMNLLDLLQKLERELPECEQTPWHEVVAYPTDEIVPRLQAGQFVVMSRAMFRAIIHELQRPTDREAYIEHLKRT